MENPKIKISSINHRAKHYTIYFVETNDAENKIKKDVFLYVTLLKKKKEHKRQIGGKGDNRRMGQILRGI